MQIYGPSRVDGPQGINGPHFRRADGAATDRPAQGADQVDISPEAQEAARLAEAAELRAAERSEAPVRTELVDRIKAEIADGTYETEEKIDSALDRLLDELG